MLKDQEARLRATAPDQSFIVQAPAGSGKTELLSQRFLRLLSTVKSPEQIIALTFTKKAASEMKERILVALMDAEQDKPLESSHQQLTRDYARAALARSRSLHWQLLQNHERLRIMTIDSLCQSLSRAIPLYEQQIPYAEVSDVPEFHYKKAVRALLAYVFEDPQWQPEIVALLEHLDNRQDVLIDLFSYLLARREQWLGFIYSAKSLSREDFEEAIHTIQAHELQRFVHATPAIYAQELQQLSHKIAHIENDPKTGRYCLQTWTDFNKIDARLAAGLAALLLTRDGKIRKSFDHHVGLNRAACPKAVYDELKAASRDLLESLNNTPDFKAALNRIKNLPEPRFEASQWRVLQALLNLLPLLAAHLELSFKEANQVDFTSISQQALLALGDETAPTDLALFMDSAIHHLLVDEFQDTSLQQFELIQKLVQGWQPDDGKTLFVVGDPMQSIYRFRQAEVGLFLKAQQQGIGNTHLTALSLCCNFRSEQGLVDWVNTQFRGIFPEKDDIESGAVSFHASVGILDNGPEQCLKACFCPDKRSEAQAIVDLIKAELAAYPDAKVALLVRSRNQLSEIVPLLRHHNVPFQGVDIEQLSSLAHLQDLWSLCQALLLPGNRLPWLALLRSPYGGLALADLYAIANFKPKEPIYYALSQLPAITGLSDAGQLRAGFIYQVMHKALCGRQQQSLTDWILETQKALHGDLLLNAQEKSDLEQFYVLLSRFSGEGELLDIPAFEVEFQKLYSERVTQSRLQIMTIHKSKGLEFDAVILPGLGSKPIRRDKPLLRWLNLPSAAGNSLLLSPIHGKEQAPCALYNYLGELSQEKELYEQQRLLYVAITRAKKRLYLFDGHEKTTVASFRELLQRQAFEASGPYDSLEAHVPQLPELKRLPLSYYPEAEGVQALGGLEYQRSFENPIPALLNQTTQTIGTAAHELLQWICDNHPASVDRLPWAMVINRLKARGFTPIEVEETHLLLRQQIEALFNSPRGQWICQAHESEHNEYALLLNENNESVTRIIDRTFIDAGHRWIIDFKTGAFSEKTKQEHQKQVNAYAAIFAGLKEPVRCGLLYLTGNHWVEWEAAVSGSFDRSKEAALA